MRKLKLAPAWALFLLLASCSESPQTATKKEPPKPAEPAAGQSALYKMYQVARSWAPDAQVLKMTSMMLEEVKDVPRGKAAAWEAVFVSPARSQLRSYTYSIIDVPPTIHKGVFAGPESGWSGPKGVNAPFPIIAVKVETTDAYQTALKQAGDYDKKNPGKPISILLEKNNRFPDPVWRIFWGESAGTSNFSVLVDASTGDFREKLH